MNRQALIVIPHHGLVDQVLATLKQALQLRRIQSVVAATTRVVCTTRQGLEVVPDLALAEVKPEQFESIIFLASSEVPDYLDDSNVLSVIHQFRRQGKVIAASGVATALLADAGILISKNATGAPSEEQHLLNHGAFYTGMPVEIDGRVATAKDASAAAEFGRRLANLLES